MNASNCCWQRVQTYGCPSRTWILTWPCWAQNRCFLSFYPLDLYHCKTSPRLVKLEDDWWRGGIQPQGAAASPSIAGVFWPKGAIWCLMRLRQRHDPGAFSIKWSDLLVLQASLTFKTGFAALCRHNLEGSKCFFLFAQLPKSSRHCRSFQLLVC